MRREETLVQRWLMASAVRVALPWLEGKDMRNFDDEEDEDYLEERPVRRRPKQQQDIGDDPAMRLLLPVGLSGWAIAAGYLGLFSVLCLPGPLALLCGILAILEMKRNPKKHGMGRAVFGIIMGSFATLGLALMFLSLVMQGLTKR
jgi:hypothetical protein